MNVCRDGDELERRHESAIEISRVLYWVSKDLQYILPDLKYCCWIVYYYYYYYCEYIITDLIMSFLVSFLQALSQPSTPRRRA